MQSMHTALEQRVLGSIRYSRMINAGARVGVAVSGGADSIALLRLLDHLRIDLGIALLVVHFDHMLRGAESDGDAKFVAELARSRGLALITAREDVSAVAARERWNIEDAARRLRYAFFDRVLSEEEATCIAIAHTADDQAETVLGRVMRGTGLTGLAGIRPIVESPSGGLLVRPLLSVRGHELREYLRAQGQEWREDSTNVDLRRLRARLRAQILPMIENDLSPAIVEHLEDLARFAREEESFWTALVDDRLITHAAFDNAARTVTIRVHNLISPLLLRTSSGEPDSGASRALTERLVRRIYEKVRGDRCDLSARHVEQIIRLATESTSGKRLELPGKIEVERIFDELVFSRARSAWHHPSARETKRRPSTYRYVVSLPDRGAAVISVPELATRFKLKMVDWPLAESDTKSESDAFDAAALRVPLILRNWQPGDAYRPRGHRQTRKLKELFLAGRIPSRQRTCWPVLESGGQVIWARGMAPADEYCARKGTSIGVVIEEDRI
jgi:tRNA(Ile)-lysidine synthase